MGCEGVEDVISFFSVDLFAVLNICVFNFSLSFFGEPELLKDTGKQTEKRTEAEKKKEM